MSKEDYYNLVQELNKNRNFPFGKPTSHKSNKRENILTPNLSEVNLKRDDFNKTPQTVISKTNKSKIIMKNTALNLLVEKSKLNEYMRFATVNLNLDGNDALNAQDPSKLTFMNKSELSPLGNEHIPYLSSASIQEQNEDHFKSQESLISGINKRGSNAMTSRLPKINRSLYGILPKINSRERKPSEVSLYLQNSLKTTTMS